MIIPASKLKRGTRRRLGALFLLVILVFTALYLAFPSEAETEDRPRYMLLMEGFNGLNFYCLDERPYTIQASQTEAEYSEFALTPNALKVWGQVIEVEFCNLDVIYTLDGERPFVWGFSQPITDGHAEHRHMTRGANWVNLIDVDWFPNN